MLAERLARPERKEVEQSPHGRGAVHSPSNTVSMKTKGKERRVARTWKTAVGDLNTSAAKHLNTIVDSGMVMSIAWGTTLSAILAHLLKKTARNAQIAQLNGAGNNQSTGIEYASEICDLQIITAHVRICSLYRRSTTMLKPIKHFGRSEVTGDPWTSIKKTIS